MAKDDDIVLWRAPAPLWHLAIEDGAPHGRFKGPTVLRFRGDDFIERYQQTLAGAPESLADTVARFETFEMERVGWLPKAALADEPRVPKLFQPAHGRFYLVCASLVCERLGFPDRKIDARAEERAFFVLRRLVPRSGFDAVDAKKPESYHEQAWCAVGDASRWITLSQPQQLSAGEERNPLFSSRFSMDGHPRTLLAGLIPVSSRESWRPSGPPAPLPDTESREMDLRLREMRRVRSQVLAEDATGAPVNKQPIISDTTATSLRREATAIFLLELQAFLETHLPKVWRSISAGDPAPIPQAQAKLVATLQEKPKTEPLSFPWAQAILDVHAAREVVYGIRSGSVPIYDLIDTTDSRVKSLFDRIEAAIDELIAQAIELPEAAQSDQPKLEAGEFFLIRCVYDRPKCKGLELSVVSDRSAVFEMAGFYDADAPVRLIHITMPDMSLASLSRYRKGVTMTLNRRLREEMERFTGVGFGNPTGGASGSFDLGTICSFSIPIVTIAALILLLIIVYVLNIVFWWVPFFRVCFPLPKAK